MQTSSKIRFHTGHLPTSVVWVWTRLLRRKLVKICITLGEMKVSQHVCHFNDNNNSNSTSWQIYILIYFQCFYVVWYTLYIFCFVYLLNLFVFLDGTPVKLVNGNAKSTSKKPAKDSSSSSEDSDDSDEPPAKKQAVTPAQAPKKVVRDSSMF